MALQSLALGAGVAVGKVEEENTLSNVCAPTWVERRWFRFSTSVTVLRVFLCDCANFPCFLAPFPFSRWIYGYNLAVSVPSFAWGARSEEKMQRIFVESFFPDSDFSLDFCILVAMDLPKPATLACILLLKKKKTKSFREVIKSWEKCRRENKLLWECFASSIQSEPQNDVSFNSSKLFLLMRLARENYNFSDDVVCIHLGSNQGWQRSFADRVTKFEVLRCLLGKRLSWSFTTCILLDKI